LIGQLHAPLPVGKISDVALMDVQMPVMDGIEATRRIRALPPPQGRQPILALTVNVMDDERRHCIAAGMNGVLTKPIDWERLFDALVTVTNGAAGPILPTRHLLGIKRHRPQPS
jgi:CheY-like chemotaxis protein